MIKRKISITYIAEEDKAFYIKTIIRSTVAHVIQECGASQMKIEMENLPVENKNFEIEPDNCVLESYKR